MTDKARAPATALYKGKRRAVWAVKVRTDGRYWFVDKGKSVGWAPDADVTDVRGDVPDVTMF